MWWNRILKCDKWTISVDEINQHNFVFFKLDVYIIDKCADVAKSLDH